MVHAGRLPTVSDGSVPLARAVSISENSYCGVANLAIDPSQSLRHML